MAEKRLQIIITAKDRASKQVKKLDTSLDKMKRTAMGLGGILAGAFAFRQISSFVSSSIVAFRRQEEEVARLTAALKNVKTAREGDVELLVKQAAALQQVTKFGDEQIISAQSMLATFQMNGEVVAALTPRILDMAAGVEKLGQGQTDLQAISLAVGKAFTMGIGALSRYGVAMTEADKKAFRLANDTEKLNIITKVLDENYKGIAKTMALTLSGKVIQLRNNFGDLKESIGEAVLAAIIPFITSMNDSVKSMNEAGEEINNLAIGLNWVAQGLFNAGKSVQAFFLALVSGASNFINIITFGLIPSVNRFANVAQDSFNQTIESMAKAGLEFEAIREDLRNGEKAFMGYGGAAVKAMDEIEEAAKSAKKEIVDLNKKITELTVERITGEMALNRRLAEAFIEQEEKVAKKKEEVEKFKADIVEAMRDDATTEDLKARNRKIAGLKKELAEAESIFEQERIAFEERRNIEVAFSDEVAEVRRRNNLTVFDRIIEDLELERIEFTATVNAKISDIQRELDKQNQKLEEVTKIDNEIAANAIAVSKGATDAVIEDQDRVLANARRVQREMQAITAQIFGTNLFTQIPASINSPAGGGGVSVIINGGIFGSDAAEELGDQIIDRLKTQGAV